MERVLVASVLVIGGVVAAITVIFAIIPSVTRSSQAVGEAGLAATEVSRTRIEIVAIHEQRDTVVAWVKNVGADTIPSIDKSDVFLRERHADRFYRISFSSAADGSESPTRTWTGDLQQRGLPWAPDQTLQVRIALTGDDRLRTCQYQVLRVFTPLGQLAEKEFLATTPPDAAMRYSITRTVSSKDTLSITGDFSFDGVADQLIGTPTISIDTDSTGDGGTGDLGATAMIISGDASTWSHEFQVPASGGNDGTARVTIAHLGDCWAKRSANSTGTTFEIDNTAPTISGDDLQGSTSGNDTITIKERAESPPEPFKPQDGEWGPADDEFIIKAVTGDGSSRTLDLTNATFNPATGATTTLIVTLDLEFAFLKNGELVSVTPVKDAVTDLPGNAMPGAEVVGTVAVTGDQGTPSLPQGSLFGATVHSPEVTGDTITITFDEGVRPSSGDDFSSGDFASMRSPGTAAPFDLTNATFSLSSGNRRTLIIYLNAVTDNAFLINTNNVAVKPATGAIVDLAGNVLPDDEIVSTALNSGDETAPTIPVANITGTTVQSTSDTITIVFDEEVRNPQGGFTFLTTDFTIESPDNFSIPLTGDATVSLSGDKRTLTITLDGSVDGPFLVNGETIAVTPATGKILDLAGNPLSAGKVFGTTVNAGDTDAPIIPVTSIVGTTIQDAGDTIVLTFNEEVKSTGGFDKDDFNSIQSPDGTGLNLTEATFVLSGDKRTLTITLNESAPDNAFLKTGDVVSITPSADSILDLAGNSLASAKVLGTPTNSGDAVAPTLGTGDITGETIQGAGDKITLTFSEAMRPADGDFSFNDLTIHSGDTTLAIDNATFTLSPDRKTLEIILNEADPDFAALDNGNTIDVTPTTDKILDLAGNSLAADKVVSVNVIAGDTTPPTVTLSYSFTRSLRSGDSLSITGDFSEGMAFAPTIAIEVDSTGDGGTGDFSATAMTGNSVGTGDTRWSFIFTVPGDEGNNGTAAIHHLRHRPGGQRKYCRHQQHLHHRQHPAYARRGEHHWRHGPGRQ